MAMAYFKLQDFYLPQGIDKSYTIILGNIPPRHETSHPEPPKCKAKVQSTQALHYVLCISTVSCVSFQMKITIF